MTDPKALTFARLVDYVEGKLSEAETAVITDQLSHADADTQETVAWLQTFWQASQTIQLAAPPATLRQQLIQRFAAQQQQTPTIWQKITAQLTFDSWATPTLAAARAATTPGWPQQLIYTCDAADIALTIDTTATHFSLSGQIFSPQAFAPDTNSNPFIVKLRRDKQDVDMFITDDLGEFNFPHLDAGTYDLLILGGNVEMQLAPIKLKSQ